MGVYEECPHCGSSKTMENDIVSQFSCGTRVSFTAEGSIRHSQSDYCQAFTGDETTKPMLVPYKKRFNVVKYN